MTIVFWLIVATLIFIALFIAIWPLWRSAACSENQDQNHRNITIARERLAELKANRDADGISSAQYEEQVAELEVQLNYDLSIVNLASSAADNSQGRWLAYVLMVAIPLVSLSLYLGLGDYGAITHPPEAVNPGQEMPSAEQINGMVVNLAEKLKTDPNNLQGWVMLGRSYKVLQKYPEAVDALAHAMQLERNNADIMLQYAEALMLANNNNWNGKPEEWVNKAVTLDPQNLTGLWFAAMVNAQKNDKKTALDFLRRLEALLPGDSPDKPQIHELIANTENELGHKPSPAPAAPVTTPDTAKVNIDVSLDAHIKAQAAPDDTVFIYAQALSGPKMPLAISRKHVSDLPLTITLSDADAMMPNMKLSNFKEVRLLARISKSASAMPQPGDLIGVVEPAQIASSQGYKIVINDQVK